MYRATCAFVLVLTAGCSDLEPLAQNEIRVHVSGLHCRPCAMRVLEAVGQVAWIDQTSIEIDATRNQIRLFISDAARYDESQLRKAFRDHDFRDVSISANPG